MTERKQLNIGLFGFGCVGFGLYQVLEKSAGIKANLLKICVKNKAKIRQIPAENFTYNPDEILDNPDINVVIELIDDSEAAFKIVKKALLNGKAVITANKKMIADHFLELLELQELTNLPVLYEAAACASIPIIRNLEEYYDNDYLNRIEGIVNGSTNFILSKTFEKGMSYSDALSLAQEVGYAESNPELDVQGMDACNKLIILIAHAFGLVLRPESILTIGIDKIGDLELRYAREKGYKIKLIAQAIKHQSDAISAIVAPQFVRQDSPLFSVDDVYNGVITETVFADRQFFSGKGAGDFPTASAVLSDMSALSYDYKYEYRKLNQNLVTKLSDEVSVEVFVRGNNEDETFFKPYFNVVKELYKDGKNCYLIGSIELVQLKKLLNDFPTASVLLFESLKSQENKIVELNLINSI